MDEVFMLLYLNSKCNLNFEIQFITDTFNTLFLTRFDCTTIKLAILKFTRLIKIKDKILIAKEKLKTHSEIIPIPVSNCIHCNKLLIQNIENTSTLVIGIKGCAFKKLLSGRCNQCDIIYKLDYYIKSEEKYLYQVDVCNSFICTSNQTVFEIKLLQWFHINLVRNTTSFSGFSDAFNEYHNNNNIVINSLYFVYQSN
jgi:hypothetical protein